MNNPDIILADEPVGALDTKSAFNVMSLFSELNQIDKKTIVLVTHDPSHARYGNKIVNIQDGKIIKIETIERKKADLDSYIMKDGKLLKKLQESGFIKEEIIPNDLRLLMRAFKNLSPAEVGSMLVPFKTEQLFSHIFFSMTNEQIELAKKRLQDYLYGSQNFEKFEHDLDMEQEKGGAGWDKRYAETFSQNVKRVIEESGKINFVESQRSAHELANYINNFFQLHLDRETEERLARVIFDRLKNKIGFEEFEKIVDLPKEKGGLNFDKRTAKKISREIEILILLRYSA